MFEVFFTTNPVGKGTGLGLPTVKRIVEAHAGFIQISSTPDEGTAFEIFLPRSRNLPPTLAEPQPGNEIYGHGQAVLVIDSTAAVCELIGEALTGHGYQVLMTNTPSEALEKVGTGTWKPDAVILGLDHPGIKGLELFAAFRRHLPAVPAILLGNPSPELSLSPPGNATFLDVPVEISNLLGRLSRLLAERRPG